MENETLATELLREVNRSCHRWFVAFCIMIVLEAATIAGFMWYLSLPVDSYSEEYTQTMEDIEGKDVRQIIGGMEDD